MSSTRENENSLQNQMDTSPVPEKWSNCHDHDSEYDSASDLEGDPYPYDYYDDDDDEDGDGNSDADFDAEQSEQSKFSKNVDEDRRNPQYIPKKATFYKHDDRTACNPQSGQVQVDENNELGKTMKKCQQTSGVDRWSHDRFDLEEQAPKSRAELASAYGYDIQSEDGPPRARRRRRYGRGPSKYSRNWEDEKKAPRPEEDQKVKKTRSFREEKKNRFENRSNHAERNAGSTGNRTSLTSQNIDCPRVEPERRKDQYRRQKGNPRFSVQNRLVINN